MSPHHPLRASRHAIPSSGEAVILVILVTGRKCRHTPSRCACPWGQCCSVRACPWPPASSWPLCLCTPFLTSVLEASPTPVHSMPGSAPSFLPKLVSLLGEDLPRTGLPSVGPEPGPQGSSAVGRTEDQSVASPGLPKGPVDLAQPPQDPCLQNSHKVAM